ncbi:MAG: hypothetical protein HKN28_20205 [Alphaproteobacteria bacterium]|nr:hypothetical protein [Alphaproteobacteria bacterium]
MDQAIWATWYDLPEDGRDEYLDWLHSDYLPALQAKPGIAWAAHYQDTVGGDDMKRVREQFPESVGMEGVGTGTQFLMLAGAAEVWTLMAPSVVDEQAALTGTARKMLDMRQGVRPCIFSTFARVDGPEMALRPAGTTPGPAIQMGSFRTANLENEFDVGPWYAQYRLPAMAKMPGCIAARVMLSAAGWAKYSVLYEFTSLEARLEHFEIGHESEALDENEWSGKLVRYTMHTPGSPTVGQRIWPPVE